jgi:hypothetical protein
MLSLGSAVAFAFMLFAPVAVNAEEDEVLALAPVAAPAVAGTSADEVRATRALAAKRALLSGDIGSMQEERLYAIVAAAPSWDATSGYGSVEDSRAAASALVAPIAAPSWDETSGYGALEASRATIGHPAVSMTDESSRVATAQQALLSGNLGSMQEEALTIAVARGTATNAPRIANDLSTRLERGTRAESPLLWSILHPEERAVMANSDDRIANALFGDQSNGDAVVEASGAEMAEYEVSVAGTPDETALLAQFRAGEMSLSRNLGVEQPEVSSCDGVD